MPIVCRNLVRPVFVVATLLVAMVALAHPEDDFCTPGDDSIDPALCRMLAELDAQDGDPVAQDPKPILDAQGDERSFTSTAWLYIKIGVKHILPDGLDHILFVLAIFLTSTRLRALVWQISAFTVAHTVTLGLAAAGIITPSPQIVEPLIALTIGFVAFENLVFKEMMSWRPLVVFGFGLIHGMGFAGFFGELGLPPGQFWSALIGFNIGVEIGQLAVVSSAAILALLIRRQMTDAKRARQYRHFVVLPSSLIIAATGFWWAFERLAG